MTSRPAHTPSRPSAASAPATAQRQLSPVDGLAQLSFLVHGMLERLAAEHGLSIVQTRLLGILRDRRPTINELAKLLALDKSSTSGLVDRAQRRGLVVRAASSTDRRSVLVGLTDDGGALVSEVSSRFEAEISMLLAGLPPSDRQALSGLISRVLVAHASDRGVDLFATIDPQADDSASPQA